MLRRPSREGLEDILLVGEERQVPDGSGSHRPSCFDPVSGRGVGASVLAASKGDSSEHERWRRFRLETSFAITFRSSAKKR